MYFDKKFTIEMNGTTYYAYVDGYLERDEHDRDVKHKTITDIILEDEQGNPVDDFHEDYDDLMNYVENMSIDEDLVG